MNTLARIVALLSLAATIVPPALFMAGRLGEVPMKQIMLGATIAWFLAAPRWLKGGEK